MKYQALKEWIEAAKKIEGLDASIKTDLDAILRFELTPAGANEPKRAGDVIDEMRNAIKLIIDKKTPITVNGKSIGELYDLLDLATYPGKEMLQDLQVMIDEIYKPNSQLQFIATRQEMLRLRDEGKFANRRAFDFSAQNDFIEYGEGGLKQVVADYYQRTFILNGNSHMGLQPTPGQVAGDMPRHKDEEIVTKLKSLLGVDDEIIAHFISAHSQGVASFVPMILGNGTEAGSAGVVDAVEDSIIINQPQSARAITTRVVGRDVYLSVRFDEFDFSLVRIGDRATVVGHLTGPVETTYKLVQQNGKWGYELVHVATANPDIMRLMRGEVLSDDELVEKYCSPEYFRKYYFDKELERLLSTPATTHEAVKLRKNAIINAKQSEKQLCGEAVDELTRRENYKILTAQLISQRKVILKEELERKISKMLEALVQLYQDVSSEDVKPKQGRSLRDLIGKKQVSDPEKIFDPVIGVLNECFNLMYELIDKSKGLDELLPMLIAVIEKVSKPHRDFFIDRQHLEKLEQVYQRLVQRVSSGDDSAQDKSTYFYVSVMSALYRQRANLLLAEHNGKIPLDQLTLVDARILFDICKDKLVTSSSNAGEKYKGLLDQIIEQEKQLQDDASLSEDGLKEKYYDLAMRAMQSPELHDSELKEVVPNEAAPGEVIEDAVVAERDNDKGKEDDVKPVKRNPQPYEEVDVEFFVSLGVEAMNRDREREREKRHAASAKKSDREVNITNCMHGILDDLQKLSRCFNAVIKPEYAVLDRLRVNINHMYAYLADEIGHDQGVDHMFEPRITLLARSLRPQDIEYLSSYDNDRAYALHIFLERHYPQEDLDQLKGRIYLLNQAMDKLKSIEKLKSACDQYMKHLGRQLYEGLRDGDFELCKQMVYRENGKLKFKLSDLMDIVDINEINIQMLRKRDPSFDMAIRKYQAVKAMRATLDGDKSPTEKWQAFETSFTQNRHTIEQRRDSGAIKFLKVLGTIFSLGLAYTRLWRVEGQEFAGKVDQQMPNDGHKPGKK